MEKQEDFSISIENKWKGVSVKSVIISQKKNTLFGSGKGSFNIFSIDLNTMNLKGNNVNKKIIC